MTNCVPVSFQTKTCDSHGDHGDSLDLDTLPSTATALKACITSMVSLYTELEQSLCANRQMARQLQEMSAEISRLRLEMAGSQASERWAWHEARHDNLTLLPNRRYFCERLELALEQARSRGRSVAVLYLDLDNFKPVNDGFGHETGDKVLGIIAARLARTVRGGDMASRLGGDEFGCLIADLPLQGRQLQRIAKGLHDAVIAPCSINGQVFSIRPSIGIARYPEDGITARELMHKADRAMYRAKPAAGRGTPQLHTVQAEAASRAESQVGTTA